jgi:formimidoylglutamate deiminase
VVHIHVAEQLAEVADSERHLGCRPLRYLLDRFPVDADWCLVHVTHVEDQELEDAARSGATAGICPTTEADLGDGLFRLSDWLQAGGAFAVGSDSNVRVSAMEELRWLEYGARLATQRRNVLSSGQQTCGRVAWQRAALAGARALDQPAGQLAPGCRADLVELDTHHPLLAGLDGDDLLQAAVFGAGRSCIRSVWIAGHCLVKSGEHCNEAELKRSFDQTIRELRA